MNSKIAHVDDDINAKLLQIRDLDLIDEVNTARGEILFPQIVSCVLYKQQCRDREAENLAKSIYLQTNIARDKRRRDIARRLIDSTPPTPKNLQHIHSVLALCGLPYRNPGNQREFTRAYGRNSLNIMAGRLKSPITGAMEVQGLPYGPKARLVMLHLCTESVRQRSPQIRINDSFSGFMKVLGFAVTGGERGTIRQFKEQLNRLASCTMQIGLWDGADNARTLNVPPFRRLDLWRVVDQDKESIKTRMVCFHQDFYDNLIQHALPVDIRAARAFSGSARKLDLLFWIGYRLRFLQRPLRLSWDSLHRQFGGENANLRSFKQAFKTDVSHFAEVFPRIPISLDGNGMVLSAVDPDMLIIPDRKRIVRRS